MNKRDMQEMWTNELIIGALIGEGIDRWVKYEQTGFCDKRVEKKIRHNDKEKAWNRMVMADNEFSDCLWDVLQLEQDQHRRYGVIANPLSVLRSLR